MLAMRLSQVKKKIIRSNAQDTILHATNNKPELDLTAAPEYSPGGVIVEVAVKAIRDKSHTYTNHVTTAEMKIKSLQICIAALHPWYHSLFQLDCIQSFPPQHNL